MRPFMENLQDLQPVQSVQTRPSFQQIPYFPFPVYEMSQAHRGRNIKSQSVGSLLKVVTSLNSFLKRAEGTTSTSIAKVTPAQHPQGPVGLHDQPALMAYKVKWPSQTPPLSTLIPSVEPLCSRVVKLAPLIPDLATTIGKQQPQQQLPGGGGQQPLTKRKLHELEREIAKPKGKWTVSTKTPGPTTVAKAAAAASGATAMAEASDDAVPALKAASVGDVTGLSRRLVALLFDCWAECGPSKTVGGGSSPDLEGLQVLTGILSAAVALLSRLLQKGGEGPGAFNLQKCWNMNPSLPPSLLIYLSGQLPLMPLPNSHCLIQGQGLEGMGLMTLIWSSYHGFQNWF